MDNELQPASSASGLPFRVHEFISQTGADTKDDDGFNRLALALFVFQFESVPIYRRFCERRGIVPGSIQYWSQNLRRCLSRRSKNTLFRASPKRSATASFIPVARRAMCRAAIFMAPCRSWFMKRPCFLGLNDIFFLATRPFGRNPLHSFFSLHAPRTRLPRILRWSTCLKRSDKNSTGRIRYMPGGSRRMAHGVWISTKLSSPCATPFPANGSLDCWARLFHLCICSIIWPRKRSGFVCPQGRALWRRAVTRGASRIVAKNGITLLWLVTKYLGVPESHIVTGIWHDRA